MPRSTDLGFDRSHGRRRSLIEELLPRGVQLRGCQPRDLVDHALSLATYLDQPRHLTRDLLNAARASCFVEDRDVEAV